MKEIEKEEGREFEYLMIHTSPFIRTIATAAEISKVLDVRRATIDNQLCEQLLPNFYDKSPFPELNYFNLGRKELDKKFGL